MTVVTDPPAAEEQTTDLFVLSPIPRSIRQLLRQERVRRGLSTEDMARLSGVEADEVEALESGSPVSTVGTVGLLVDLDRLAAAVGVPNGVIVEETVARWARAFARVGEDLATEDPATVLSRAPSAHSQLRSERSPGLAVSTHPRPTLERLLLGLSS
jgi:transcriptional regulator with XRE-family HTH domain